MSTDFRSLSKRGYTSDSATIENINAGSFQRIADACELMAQNHLEMQRKLADTEKKADMYYRWYLNECERSAGLQRSMKSLRGVITKQKKKINALNGSVI